VTVVRYIRHLEELVTSELIVWIGRSLPFIIRRSLRRGLRGVWVQGAWDTLPEAGFVLAVNHHSWWDVYLMFMVRERLNRRLSGLMLSETLRRFPFFRQIGVIAEREVREALRRLAAGHGLVVFPEGVLNPPGALGALQPGAVYLAHKAQVPIIPLAVRVVMRGAEKPEAYLVLGAPIAPSPVSDEALTEYQHAMNTALQRLDNQLRQALAEDPLPDFTPWVAPQPSFNERFNWLRRLWR
jgi:1-acyl-sn-glycerol-3-phosphate acyltransferase